MGSDTPHVPRKWQSNTGVFSGKQGEVLLLQAILETPFKGELIYTHLKDDAVEVLDVFADERSVTFEKRDPAIDTAGHGYRLGANSATKSISIRVRLLRDADDDGRVFFAVFGELVGVETCVACGGMIKLKP